jgi:tetratricopeptide (TPR) repeat protein
MGSDRTQIRRRKQSNRGDAPHLGPSAGLSARLGGWQTWLAAGVLAAAGLTAYANSFRGAFVYDDLDSIADNPFIHTLWPLSEAMSLPMINDGATVSRRPLLSLSFALNYQLFGGEPWGFHLVNLAVHIGAALLLFGVVRRTLCLKPFRSRWGDKAAPLALVIALLWEVHPLQTESVTYMVQRAESLMGMLYLLTLYCSLRGFTSDRGKYWLAAAVAACAAGMGVKEVMATAPLMVFLYDGTFISTSYRDAWRRRWRFYAALAATWLVLLLPQALGWNDVSEDFTERSPLAYALTQPGVILYYLRLSFWPSPLVMDYNWPTAEGLLQIAAAGCVVAALLGATAWGLYRRRWYGVVGAWFFLILAPSSSFVALNQNLEEHRMYLSLAAVVLLTVIAGAWLLQRLPFTARSPFARGAAGVLVVALAAGLTAQTINRNRDYRSQVALWRQNVEDRPTSYVAHQSLGLNLFLNGRVDEAIAQYRRGLEYNPQYAPTWYSLANALARRGELPEAIADYRQSLMLDPNNADAHCNLGTMLLQLGKRDEALTHFREATRVDAQHWQGYYNLAMALQGQGKLEAAIQSYRRSLQINPRNWTAHYKLGNLLAEQGRLADAAAHFQRALQINPRDARTHIALGATLQELGQHDQAISHFRQAVAINPSNADAHFNLANALAMQGDLRQAVAHYRQSLLIRPEDADAHCNLGTALLQLGIPGEALTHLREATRIDSRHWRAYVMLGKLYLDQGKREPATENLQRALEIQPDSQLARQLLQEARGA